MAAEDLAQEVMFTVYRKAEQIRDRSLFRAWMFKIARNTLSRHFGKQAREVDTVDLADVPERLVAASNKGAGTPAFEFHHWMAFLDSREREALTLRFIEQWEYHEIAAAQSIPIGTVQWRVFSAKRKLAPYLKRVERTENRKTRIAA
jgi:RNA polymerase sigma-70 factor (ECF subfamily)